MGAEGLAIVERVVGEHLRRAEGVEVCFDRVEVGSVNVWLGGVYGARSWGSYRPLPDEVQCLEPPSCGDLDRHLADLFGRLWNVKFMERDYLQRCLHLGYGGVSL